MADAPAAPAAPAAPPPPQPDWRQRAEDAEAKVAALAAQLAAVRTSDEPPPPPPPSSRRFPGGAAAALADCAEAAVIVSPYKASAVASIQASLAHVDLCAPPLSPALARISAAASLERWRGVSSDALLREHSGYPVATVHVPPWVEARARAATDFGAEAASTLFLGRSRAPDRPAIPAITVPWSCFPELLTKPRERFHPAFNGEIKSAISAGDKERPHMFDELLTYAMLGMLASFFRDVPERAHRFFRAPPYAFCLAAFPHLGYFVAVEWAGKLFASTASEPFFLGSDAHGEAAARLPDCDFSHDFEDVVVDDVAVRAWPAAHGSRAAVIWRDEPPAACEGDARAFFKILRGNCFDAPFFRRLHATYAAYAAARARAPAADAPPPALLEAELLFGAGEVCVRMPWARGRDAALADLRAGGVAVAPVARAIVWLARRGLLYVDLREPNVRVDEGGGGAPRVALVDYDDIVVLTSAPPATALALVDLLGAHGAAFVAARADAPGARPAVVAALYEAW